MAENHKSKGKEDNDERKKYGGNHGIDKPQQEAVKSALMLKRNGQLGRRAVGECSNREHLKQARYDCQEAVSDAADFLEANRESNRGREAIQGSGVSEIRSWQRPPYGYFKVNFDGGMDGEGKQCGLGMVLRDWQGRFIAARAVHKHHVTDPLMVEALAARESLQFASELGWITFFLKAILNNWIRPVVHEAIKRRAEMKAKARYDCALPNCMITKTYGMD
ncbi:hypothetical protein RHMOL_Rhmol01G0370100 [Rhododendron molle]|uniref:Uncharacterized protein n=1 Tax=Rhododendron molle TaxID=49168 RepID=A0ACC0QA79_RHOML|nr:hypothetical protein RHMOL_Rhmol01G0370100 [Rhododendron molle]